MPFEGHRFFWTTTAAEGCYLLMSSKYGKEGLLFCWDTKKHDFLYKKSVFGNSMPGPIEEALPGGLVIGHTTGGDKSPGLLYGLRADTGEILWQKQVPVKPITAFASVRRHNYAFRRGPDGFIWTFFDNTLVRIDPRNAKIEPVGEVFGNPVQIAFANDGVYVAGSGNLRRIRGLCVKNLK
jgi:outer membrane protein assembly factor BamB